MSIKIFSRDDTIILHIFDINILIMDFDAWLLPFPNLWSVLSFWNFSSLHVWENLFGRKDGTCQVEQDMLCDTLEYFFLEKRWNPIMKDIVICSSDGYWMKCRDCIIINRYIEIFVIWFLNVLISLSCSSVPFCIHLVPYPMKITPF